MSGFITEISEANFLTSAIAAVLTIAIIFMLFHKDLRRQEKTTIVREKHQWEADERMKKEKGSPVIYGSCF
jgi:uncharacterized membrane protein YdjX (TVP38/TMEM64 family)